MAGIAAPRLGHGYVVLFLRLRVAPSVMVSELMRDFAVGGAILGNLSAFYFYGYSTMQVPVGVLMDRFGPRRLLTLSALACTVGCLRPVGKPCRRLLAVW
jgi:MFS family permease